MVGYIEMQYPTTVIAENDEHKKDFETGGWDREKIERDEFFRMILQECSPVLWWWATVSNQVLRYGCFRDFYAQLQKLSVYSWCTPKWVGRAHSSNQLPDFSVNPRSPSVTTLPALVVAKTLTMPADHCSRPHNMQNIRPAGPKSSQDHPKQTVGIRQVRPGIAVFQCCQLLPQRQIFKCQFTVTADARLKGSEDYFEPLAHRFTLD